MKRILEFFILQQIGAQEMELITKWPWNKDHPAGLTAKLLVDKDFVTGIFKLSSLTMWFFNILKDS